MGHGLIGILGRLLVSGTCRWISPFGEAVLLNSVSVLACFCLGMILLEDSSLHALGITPRQLSKVEYISTSSNRSTNTRDSLLLAGLGIQLASTGIDKAKDGYGCLNCTVISSGEYSVRYQSSR